MKYYCVLKYKLKPNSTQLQKLYNMFIDANNIWKNIIENSLTDPRFAKNFKSKYLGSQLKQDLFIEFKNLLKSQKELKKLNKSGLIKYKPKYTISAFSNQPIRIVGNKIHIQKIGQIYSRGIKSNQKYLDKLKLRKIISNYKFVAFQILKRASGFYVHAIVELKDYDYKKYQKYSCTGVDLGIKDNMILSNSQRINWYITESRKLKQYQQKLSKIDKKDDYLRFKKLVFKIRKEHEKLEFKKQHIISTLINLFKQFEIVAIQDEMIKSWQESYFGEQIQHRFYGRIYEKLKQMPNVIVIDKSIPTTKTCSNCGNIQEISLDQRIYRCNACQIEIDRDLNSALNILKIATNQINSVFDFKINLVDKYIKVS